MNIDNNHSANLNLYPKKRVYTALGIMTGTSCDGIDLAILRSDGENIIEIKESGMSEFHGDFNYKLKHFVNEGFLSANIIDYRNLENEYTKNIVNSIKTFLGNYNYTNQDIDLIGFHGQTIYHDPTKLITDQMGNAFLLNKLTNIKTIANFRQKDVVNNGQGAPLVPIFHKFLLGKQNNSIAILNIGGVANLTYLDENGNLIAFDTGPGNALIDKYMQIFFNKNYDMDGDKALKGKINKNLTDSILMDSYFQQKPPKSLDKNHFKIEESLIANLPKEDVIASLSYVTIKSIINSLNLLSELPKTIYLTGGGRKNNFIVSQLKEKLRINIENIDKIICGDNMEAYAFAFLAIRSYLNMPITYPTTTGVNIPITGGILYT